MESSEQSSQQNTTITVKNNCIKGTKCVQINNDDGVMVQYTIYDVRSRLPVTVTTHKKAFERNVRPTLPTNSNCSRYVEEFQRLLRSIG